MKKILSIYSLLSLFAVLILASCEDEDLIRYPNIEKSIAAKLQLDPNTTIFDALDVPNALIRYDLFTFGDNLAETRLYVDYYNFAQDSVYDRVLLQTFTAADYAAGDGSIFGVELTAVDIANALAIPIDSIAGGDRMDFKLFHNDTQGNLFPDSVFTVPDPTPGPDENGDPQDGDESFNMTPGDLNSLTTTVSTQFTVYVACPVDPNFAVGKYKFEQTSGIQDPWFGTGNVLATQDEVLLTAPNLITRRFEPVSYATFEGGQFDILFVCDNILIPYTPAPASCGGGLGWTLDPNNIPSYSEPVDSLFVIDFWHNPTADCGLPSNDPIQIVLTKIDD